jgi:hypothetical protein
MLIAQRSINPAKDRSATAEFPRDSRNRRTSETEETDAEEEVTVSFVPD